MNWWSAISCHAYDFKYLLEDWIPSAFELSKKKFKKGSDMSNGGHFKTKYSTETKEASNLDTQEALISGPQNTKIPLLENDSGE